MSKNISGNDVEKWFEQLPDELELEEVAALTLTLVNRYLPNDPKEAVNVFLTNTIIYAKHMGIENDNIALLLTAAAKHLTKNKTKKPSEKRMH